MEVKTHLQESYEQTFEKLAMAMMDQEKKVRTSHNIVYSSIQKIWMKE